MLCHQHTSEAAHAACQRCQRGLCRACSQQFSPRLCTHCVEASVSARTRAARRTLWLALPVFALPAWATARALSSSPARLFYAQLAGMLAVGVWFGLRRWRRAPSLAGDVAPDTGSALPSALAGVAFWPWLLVEARRDIALANQLRAYVPEEQRVSTFGFGEASLIFASVAAAFTLTALGLTTAAPRVEPSKHEAALVERAPQAKRGGASVAAAAPAPQAEPQSEAARAVPALPGVPSPDASTPEVAAKVEPTHARHHRKHEPEAEAAPPVATQGEPEAAPEAPVLEAPKPVLDRRYVPGSEMAKQALSGNQPPDGSYVTSSGRVVIKAPPLAK